MASRIAVPVWPRRCCCGLVRESGSACSRRSGTIGTLKAGVSATVRFVLVPGRRPYLDLSASARSVTADPIPANNTARAASSSAPGWPCSSRARTSSCGAASGWLSGPRRQDQRAGVGHRGPVPPRSGSPPARPACGLHRNREAAEALQRTCSPRARSSASCRPAGTPSESRPRTAAGTRRAWRASPARSARPDHTPGRVRRASVAHSVPPRGARPALQLLVVGTPNRGEQSAGRPRLRAARRSRPWRGRCRRRGGRSGRWW